MERSRLVHPLEPVYNKESRVLILGSFPSVVSREHNFYYAHPQNRFWKVLAEVYQEEIQDRKAFCLKHRIALWDVIASCTITGSEDQSIADVVCNDISAVLETADIRCVMTTGGKASALYRKYMDCGLPHVSLPSTSSANARMKLADLAEKYRILKEYTDEEN